ncbi:MAG: hypothetical protein AAGD01_15790 [Acidobacteriota bacterium]
MTIAIPVLLYHLLLLPVDFLVLYTAQRPGPPSRSLLGLGQWTFIAVLLSFAFAGGSADGQPGSGAKLLLQGVTLHGPLLALGLAAIYRRRAPTPAVLALIAGLGLLLAAVLYWL